MKRHAIGMATCVALLGLAVSASAQPDTIQPGVALRPGGPGGLIGKVSFDHDAVPVPVDHDGIPVQNPNPVPWLWHPNVPHSNVAGLQFKLKYDPYEVNILGIQQATTGPFIGHYNFPPPNTLMKSLGTTVPANSLPKTVTGTVWVSHLVGQASGISIDNSQTVPFLSLFYQPRHTSHVSELQFNSEVDIAISELAPIYHVTTQDVSHQTSVWIPQHVSVAGASGTTVTVHDPASFTFTTVVPNSSTIWTHVSSISGMPVSHSQIVFGPLDSNSAPTPTAAATSSRPCGSVA